MAIVIYNVCCNKVNKWITMCFTDSIIGHFHTLILIIIPFCFSIHDSCHSTSASSSEKGNKLNWIKFLFLIWPLYPQSITTPDLKKLVKLDIQTVHCFYELGVPYLLIHHHSQSLTFGEPSSCDAFYWIEKYKWNKLESNLVK